MADSIIVTGGAGYIGSHTVVELLAEGYKPIIVDNFCNSEKSVLDGLKKITGKEITLYEGIAPTSRLCRGCLKKPNQ